MLLAFAMISRCYCFSPIFCRYAILMLSLLISPLLFDELFSLRFHAAFRCCRLSLSFAMMLMPASAAIIR